MPVMPLNNNQMTTMGANDVASLAVPKGWMRKRRARIAQVTPMIVPVEISGAATLRP